MGEPSAQTASGEMRNDTVNGGPERTSKLRSDGASTRSGEATKFPLESSSMARGRTCSRTVYQVQVYAEHSLVGFRHSGHPSAPKAASPPRVGWSKGVGFGPPPPVQAA